MLVPQDGTTEFERNSGDPISVVRVWLNRCNISTVMLIVFPSRVSTVPGMWIADGS
jgi:hypothetical protein